MVYKIETCRAWEVSYIKDNMCLKDFTFTYAWLALIWNISTWIHRVDGRQNQENHLLRSKRKEKKKWIQLKYINF